MFTWWIWAWWWRGCSWGGSQWHVCKRGWGWMCLLPISSTTQQQNLSSTNKWRWLQKWWNQLGKNSWCRMLGMPFFSLICNSLIVFFTDYNISYNCHSVSPRQSLTSCPLFNTYLCWCIDRLVAVKFSCFHLSFKISLLSLRHMMSEDLISSRFLHFTFNALQIKLFADICRVSLQMEYASLL